MKLEEAYAQLGLEPLDDFVYRTAEDNGQRYARNKGPDDPADMTGSMYRRIGATTWMCVEAALALDAGTDVLLVSDTADDSQRLLKLVLDFAFELSGLAGEKKHRESCVEFGTTKLYCAHGKDVTGRVGFKGKLFKDCDWKMRAIRRAQGPFAMTRRIEKEGTQFFACDEDGVRLMELAEEGARDILAKDQTIPFYVDGKFSRRNAPGLEKDALLNGKPLTIDETREAAGYPPLPSMGGTPLTAAQTDALLAAIQKQEPGVVASVIEPPQKYTSIGLRGALTLEGAPVVKTMGWKPPPPKYRSPR